MDTTSRHNFLTKFVCFFNIEIVKIWNFLLSVYMSVAQHALAVI